jgi:hypothetical protein
MRKVEELFSLVRDYGAAMLDLGSALAKPADRDATELAGIEPKAMEDAIRTALSAALPQWRPISEAPRDGTEILAWADEVVRMKWVEGDDYGLWVYADETLSDICPDAIQPAHFQPLPPPPEATP